MTESPSLLLQRAADKLEELASQASPPRWSADDLTDAGHPGVWWVKAYYEDEESYGSHCVAELETVNPKADATWIAAMSPAVATPLVAWLRDSAASVREHDEDIVANGRKGEYCPNENQALEFARLVLGVPSKEEESSSG